MTNWEGMREVEKLQDAFQTSINSYGTGWMGRPTIDTEDPGGKLDLVVGYSAVLFFTNLQL